MSINKFEGGSSKKYWNNIDQAYRTLLKNVFEYGIKKKDRTGIGTRSIFNSTLTIDLRNSDFTEINENVYSAFLPMLTSKKMFFKNVPAEFCWIWNGLTNIEYLHKYNCHIWDEWADENGDLGPVYGYQLRYFGGNQGVNEGLGIDQLKNIINTLKNNPSSRRIMASYWNPCDLPYMKLEPCHYGFQCEVHKESGNTYLSLKFNMRSVDCFLGLPQDILLYTLILYILCAETGYKPGYLIGTFGDTHIYSNHLEQVRDYLYDEDFRKIYCCPKVIINLNNILNTGLEQNTRINVLTELTPERITLDTKEYNYCSNVYLKAPIAV